MVDKDEKLHGLIVVDDSGSVSAEMIEDWEKRYATPGLSSLVVCSVRDFTEGVADIHDPDLVIPISSHADSGDED